MKLTDYCVKVYVGHVSRRLQSQSESRKGSSNSNSVTAYKADNLNISCTVQKEVHHKRRKRLALQHNLTMAPNVVHVTPCQPSDIRVPPIVITDASILNVFPELHSHRTGHLASTTASSRIESRESHVGHNLPRSPSKSELGQDKVEILQHEASSLDLMKNSHQSENVLAEDYNENHKFSSMSDTADDLFNNNYVLPANTDWWQLSEIEEFSLPATPDYKDFDVVDVPHFGDSLSNSDLWEDVDTFVSVVDVSSDDVFESCDVHEPVYKLDTRVTTVWGLDVIWEEEEE